MRHTNSNNMSSSADNTPFKSMDIKAAFLAGSGRKRKASSSQSGQIDSKSPRLSNDESDVILLESDSTAKIQDTPAECFSSDCKENTDLNVTDAKQIINSKMSEDESENNICESSSDELNSSIQNSSINASLNTSGISVTADECNENPEKTSNKIEIKLGETNSNNQKVKKRKKMTPEEAKKRAEEREKQKAERELKKKELEEKRRQRELEKEQKQREREVLKQRLEFERQERERLKQEKKEQEEKEKLQRLKEKEEKTKNRQMVLEMRMEEKKRKEEQRLKREEELKKAEEEKRKAKLEKEQKEKEKKERAKAHFFKFFVKEDVQSAPVVPQVTEKEGAFLPFQVSDDMILAPVVPLAAQQRFDKTKLDAFLLSQSAKELYLQILKSGKYKDVRCRKKERKAKTCDSDIIIVDNNVQAELHLKAKLLQFSENVRPPYWGTWRKRSKFARPRNPFGQDEIFDYDVDSDDEWDEGGPGESLSGTENEDESEDDYEVDNEFFVPHGYLSEEENEDDEDEETNDPEKKKALLKIKLQEFEMERKQKTTELKPVILGCFFAHDDSFQDSGLYKLLQAYEAQFILEGSIPTSFTIQKVKPKSDTSPSTSDSANAVKKKIQYVPEKAMPDLIRLVHGNPKNRSFLVQEFQNFWAEQNGDSINERITTIPPTTEAEKVGETPSENCVTDLNQISKRQLSLTIKKISAYGKCPDASYKKFCWWVHDDVRKKYGLTDVPVPNQWNYSVKKDSEDLSAAKSNSVSIKGFLVT
ncbi:LOW QUALITY PROTEIN: chromatin assembly factor 1 subunit A-like [Uloborus diversus]|uniref:LOW QUALITY PROTEIN: chromatin assembly factor 1 subunit A-like n=1 Tax=Uloborus diversus TaxID=327109 RepID=UPI0024094B56|nr:LOW QUALITY PROTEIN: chromatin assembly factor 1 subunit A-like [Uloborus diversus]